MSFGGFGGHGRRDSGFAALGQGSCPKGQRSDGSGCTPIQTVDASNMLTCNLHSASSIWDADSKKCFASGEDMIAYYNEVLEEAKGAAPGGEAPKDVEGRWSTTAMVAVGAVVVVGAVAAGAIGHHMFMKMPKRAAAA